MPVVTNKTDESPYGEDSVLTIAVLDNVVFDDATGVNPNALDSIWS